MDWAGVVGRTFTQTEFWDWVHTVRFGAWHPSFAVVHNTGAPNRSTWHSWEVRGHPTPEQWGRNLEAFYRDYQGWSAGPHFFVLPGTSPGAKLSHPCVLAFTPMNVPGVHSPSWNRVSLGIETVGDYDTDVFDQGVEDNLVYILAVLHTLFGWNPAHYIRGRSGLHFHKEDYATTHKNCPGKHIVKPALVKAVTERMVGLRPHTDHPSSRAALLKPKPNPRSRVLDYSTWIVESEGSKLNTSPLEPGGASMMGVSMETFIHWRELLGQPRPVISDLALITVQETMEIYDYMYYQPIHGKDLPPGIDYCLLDSAINNGVGGAIRIAQHTLDAPIDGVLGPVTLKRLMESTPRIFIPKFCELRLAYLKRSPEWTKYEHGWTNRVNRIEKQALSLAKG